MFRLLFCAAVAERVERTWLEVAAVGGRYCCHVDRLAELAPWLCLILNSVLAILVAGSVAML